jgi:hypothetical protein
VLPPGVVEPYVLDDHETVLNDAALSDGSVVERLPHDLEDGRITSVDAGPNTKLGPRLRALREHHRARRGSAPTPRAV